LSENKINNNNNSNYGNDYTTASRNDLPSLVNPLAEPLPVYYEFYKRLKLFPWWLQYNIGISKEAILKDKIIQLGTMMGLQDRWIHRIIRHAVSEFSKKGLGSDYYGYHNIDHELEAAYFTLLAANGQNKEEEKANNNNKFSIDDIKYLFVASLFHDYDPLKQFDKPHEDAVEWFLRNDDKIKGFIKAVGINIDIVVAIIHRTAYPFRGKIAEHAEKRMEELFTYAGIADHDTKTRKHYQDIGWFLSVSERIAGYALGGFERSMELARTNAHALGWHPSRINEESVKYFSILKEEKEMFERVLCAVPDEYKKNFYDNVAAFKEAWANEIEIRNSIRRGKISLISIVEKTIEHEEVVLEPTVRESVLNIHRELHIPVGIKGEKRFRKSLNRSDTILITLRVVKDDNDKFGEIVGYAKGGPLENYNLRRGTHDENWGKKNTAYMEWISIKPGYWGETGGHLLRIEFLKEAKRRGYSYITSYVHRNVIMQRVNKGENIEIVQKYDPDKLDYYRVNVSMMISSPLAEAVTHNKSKTVKSIDMANMEMDKTYPIID
jgi:GNAT superfamily N-acetyltransferase/histone H3/H4